jgi:transcriptional regulator with XRE-family HTH domain
MKVKKMPMTYTLKPVHELAALRIASGWTQKATAQEAGVTEQTLSASWMKNPAFVAAINRERKAMLEATRDHLRTLGTKATKTLEEVLDNAQKPADKLRAAEMVLRLLGLDDPEKGLYGWGVGKTTAEEVLMQEAEAKQLKAMISRLF